MDNERFLTPGSFNRGQESYNRGEIEEVVNRIMQRKEQGNNWKREEIPNLVVSINTYDKALELIEKLNDGGVEGNITEGGVILSIYNLEQLTVTESILTSFGLQIQVGITNFEAGRHTIHALNTAKKRKKNAPNN